jgi:flagellar basal-body rod protein FlgC
MSLFNIFAISSSAMAAQSTRLNTVASNIANADSTPAAGGAVYRSKQVVFQAMPQEGYDGLAGVQVSGIVESNAPSRSIFNPGHPLADGQGYVEMPNVNVVEEMVNMLSASRSYQTNVEIMNTAKTMLQKTLALGQ